MSAQLPPLRGGPCIRFTPVETVEYGPGSGLDRGLFLFTAATGLEPCSRFSLGGDYSFVTWSPCISSDR